MRYTVSLTESHWKDECCATICFTNMLAVSSRPWSTSENIPDIFGRNTSIISGIILIVLSAHKNALICCAIKIINSLLQQILHTFFCSITFSDCISLSISGDKSWTMIFVPIDAKVFKASDATIKLVLFKSLRIS